MGVWMEAESTVMTVSQGIKRPKGANAALNFLGAGTPAVLSENRLMGVSNSVWHGGTTGNGCGDAFAKADETTDAGVDGDEADDAGGGLNFCMGRTTDCTTWGLLVLLPSGVTAMASSGAAWCLRMSLKIIKAP